MRTWLAIAVAAAQIALLAFMAGQREWVLRTGRTIWLRTAPVDPNDPMRGNYARLDYEISRVPRSMCRDGAVKWFDGKPGELYRQLRDRRVYAEMKTGPEGLTELVALSDRPPPAGTYLRGRTESLNGNILLVRYGIEAFFMQQGKAGKLEDSRGGDHAGVPLDMEVAVSPGGLAVVKGYRWEPLGLTLTLDRPPRPAVPARPGDRRRGITGATVELKNHSDQPVAIVVRPQGRSFRLVRNERWGWVANQPAYQWVGAADVLPPPGPDQVRILPPGQSYREHLDFTNPAWFVIDAQGKNGPSGPVSLETLTDAWGSSFRIEYAPPAAAECAGLPQAGLIRHTRLQSRAFSPAGGGD